MIYERCAECRAWDARQEYCRASSLGECLCDTLTGTGFTRLPGGIAGGVYLPQAGDPAVVPGLYPAEFDHERRIVV